MTTTNLNNSKKQINENQKRISNVSSNAKKLQKSLGAIRSFMLEYSNELGLTTFEIKTLQATKKDSAKYERLKNAVQFTKNDTTCVYWVIRTLAKFERKEVK